jgi:hypothetical protein
MNRARLWPTLLAAIACGGGAGDGNDASTNDDGGNDVAQQGDTQVEAGTPTYPVYDGCEAPATTFARTTNFDPTTTTLADAFAKKQIQPGDHVVVMAGAHGAVKVTKYTNPELVGSTAWIWLDFQDGATATSLDVEDVSRFLITRPTVSAPGVTLASFSSASDMVLADAHLQTVQDASAWTANDWINTASSGISARNGSCISLLRNKVLNTRFGIAIFTDALARPDSSMKTLAQGNEVANFSGDAMRVIASDVVVRNNYLHDVYVSQADGDDNHDDALQMWALNGATFDNITIDGNWVQETTNATRALQNNLQGLDDFDGVNTHVSITNNVVIVSAYHGISLYGSQDSLMDHNTVANPTSNGFKTWIMVNDTKAAQPSVNLTVTNNAATEFDLASTTTNLVSTNDVVVASPQTTYKTFDTAKMLFDFTPQPGSVLDGKNAGAPMKTPPSPLP